MTNQEILILSVNKWATDIIMKTLPKITLPQSNFSKFIGSALNVDLSNYNILNEFSFLIPELLNEPIHNYVGGFINKLGLEDDALNEYATKIIDKCILQCNETGKSINIYGLEFSGKSFENLKKIYQSCLDNENNR